MLDTLTKACRTCGAIKNLETEFGVKSDAPDGRRQVCKVCFNDARSATKLRDVKNLKNHDRIVKAAKKALEKPELLPPNQLHKMNQIVNGDEKKRAKLQAKIQEAHAAEEAVRQSNNPSLVLVQQNFGSPIMLTVTEMRDQLARAKIALGNLTGPDDGPARQHIEAYIERVEFTVKQHDDLEAEMARDAQEALNEKVCRRVIGRVHDEFLPLIRGAVTAEAKVALREKIRARKKSLMAMAKTATGLDKSGAERAVVAKAVADAMEKLALMLYSGTAQPLQSDTLENLQSRIDAEQVNAEVLERAEAERRQYWEDLRQSNPEQFEKESKSLVRQIKGDDYWSQMQREAARRLVRQDPVEAARRALLALQPRNVALPNIVYVIQEGRKETWLWPSGKPVIRGTEVTYDARLKYWTLMPGPAGIELDAVAAKPVKQEWYQDEWDADEDGPKWKQRPEGSGISVQQNDGTWKRIDNSSPWTRPEKITFRRAEAPASPQHTEMRHGKWFTQAEVDKAAAADAANPASILPPLPRFSVADSIAVPLPSTAADRAKDAKPLETVWQRSDRLRHEQAEREAALLRG